jgi:hypothetical protein
MTVMVSVPGALFGAVRARTDTSLEQAVGDESVRVSRPGQKSRREAADVGAVQTQPNARTQFADVHLHEIGIRARGARLKTSQAGIDGVRDGRCTERDGRGHGLKHLFGVAQPVTPRLSETTARG